MPRGVIALPSRGRVYSNPGAKAAITLTNSFEGGTNTTSISHGNSGGTSGNAFDVVTIGSGGTGAFSTVRAAHGSVSGLFQTTTANGTFASWTTSMGVQSQVWFRTYLFFTANPAAATRFFTVANAAATGCARWSVSTGGKILAADSAGTTITTSTHPIPLNQWFRVEGFAILSATAGQTEFKIFLSPDSQSPDEISTSTATQNTLGGASSYNFGPASGVGSQGPFNMDDIGLSNVGYLGPSSFPGPASTGHPSRAPIRQTFSKGWSSGTVPQVIPLTSNAEGGTTGTTVTAANSATSGAAFNTVAIVANGTLVYDNTRTAHGSLSYKVATGVTSGTVLAEWTTSLGGHPQPIVYFRQYLYYTANPASASKPFESRVGASNAGGIQVSATGLLQLFDSGFTTRATFSNAIPLNQWFRIEGYVIGHASAGAVSCSMFSPMDSVTPVETHTVTGINTLGFLTAVFFGEMNTGANQGPFWMDDIGVSTAGPLGPAGLPSGAIFYNLPHPVRAVIPGRIIGGGRIPGQNSTPPYVPPVNPKTQATGLDGSPLPSIITTFVSM